MFPQTQSTTQDLTAQLASSKVASTNAGDGAGKAFIKFDFESGAFAFGRDGVDITGDEIIVNTQSITHGWTLWHNRKPTKVKAPFYQELPAAPAPIGADHPAEARAFDARFEDDKETILDFSTNTYGGRKGADTLLNAVKIRSAGGELQYLYPIVKLNSESYPNAKRGGKLTYNPVFTIVDWVSGEGVRESATPKLESVKSESSESDKPSTSETPAPKKRRRRKAS